MAPGNGTRTSRDVGQRYCWLLGQSGVLAHIRRVCEPPHTYTSFSPPDHKLTMLPRFPRAHDASSLSTSSRCFLAFHEFTMLPRFPKGHHASALSTGDSKGVTISPGKGSCATTQASASGMTEPGIRKRTIGFVFLLVLFIIGLLVFAFLS